MEASGDKLDRREFLARSAQTAAAAAIPASLASGAAPAAGEAAPGPRIPERVLGGTGLVLPVLGFGGAALPKLWGNPLSVEDRIRLVRYSYERGIRYFDTAGNYMESQPILGEALKDLRDSVCLATKVETTKPGEVRAAVEGALGQLQTDYIDIIQIHGTPGLEDMSVETAMKVHGELLKLREERVVRFIGFSAHSYFDKALALISTGGFDQCMLSYGYIPRGYNQVWSARMVELRNACLAEAHKRGMGIVAMKVVGGGLLGAWAGDIRPEFDEERLGKLPAAAMRFVMQDERVHLYAIGMRLEEEVDANIRVVVERAPYTSEDRELLASFCSKAYERDPLQAMRID